MPRRLLTSAVLALALTAGACGSDSDVTSDRARTIIATATGDPTDVPQDDDTCTTETIIDEYGFEIEVENCDES